jgi:hypothetical protein
MAVLPLPPQYRRGGGIVIFRRGTGQFSTSMDISDKKSIEKY